MKFRKLIRGKRLWKDKMNEPLRPRIIAGPGKPEDQEDNMNEKNNKNSKKSHDYYLSLPYRYGIIADSIEGGYTAFYPDLPGCLTCAETLERLKDNAEEAKRLWLEAALEDLDSIPEPTPPGPEGFPCYKSTQDDPDDIPDDWSESDLEKCKHEFLQVVYKELDRRIFIGKAHAKHVMDEFPMLSLHYPPNGNVDEILEYCKIIGRKGRPDPEPDPEPNEPGVWKCCVKCSTVEMFEKFYGKPFDEITQEDIGPGGEIDWGEDVGGEILPDAPPSDDALLDSSMEAILSARYPEGCYSLDGYREEAICMEKTKTGWVVYTGERNNRFESTECKTHAEACFALFGLLTNNQDEIRKMSAELLDRSIRAVSDLKRR